MDRENVKQILYRSLSKRYDNTVMCSNRELCYIVITLDRFLVIIFPFRVCRLDRNRTRRLMTLVWLLAALLSALPLAYKPYFQ